MQEAGDSNKERQRLQPLASVARAPLFEVRGVRFTLTPRAYTSVTYIYIYIYIYIYYLDKQPGTMCQKKFQEQCMSSAMDSMHCVKKRKRIKSCSQML